MCFSFANYKSNLQFKIHIFEVYAWYYGNVIFLKSVWGGSGGVD